MIDHEELRKQRQLAMRRLYRRSDVTFEDKVVDGWLVTSIHCRGHVGSGAIRLGSRRGARAVDLALENLKRKLDLP